MVSKFPGTVRGLTIEGHLRGIHRFLELRVFHDRLVDAVAVLLAPVDDPSERDHLVVLELHGLRKGRDLARLSVVSLSSRSSTERHGAGGGVSPVGGHRLAGIELGPGNRNDDGIDVIRHGTSVGVESIGPITPAAARSATDRRRCRSLHLEHEVIGEGPGGGAQGEAVTRSPRFARRRRRRARPSSPRPCYAAFSNFGMKILVAGGGSGKGSRSTTRPRR